jgi:hypothetical protein
MYHLRRLTTGALGVYIKTMKHSLYLISVLVLGLNSCLAFKVSQGPALTK